MMMMICVVVSDDDVPNPDDDAHLSLPFSRKRRTSNPPHREKTKSVLPFGVETQYMGRLKSQQVAVYHAGVCSLFVLATSWLGIMRAVL